MPKSSDLERSYGYVEKVILSAFFRRPTSFLMFLGLLTKKETQFAPHYINNNEKVYRKFIAIVFLRAVPEFCVKNGHLKTLNVITVFILFLENVG